MMYELSKEELTALREIVGFIRDRHWSSWELKHIYKPLRILLRVLEEFDGDSPKVCADVKAYPANPRKESES